MSARSRTVASVISAMAVLGAGTAACTSGEEASSASSVLTVAAYSQPTLQANFNPFSPNALRGTVGLIYEQLFDFNTADKNQFMPGLATKYTWDAGGKALHLELDNRAKWSDGTALSRDDVVFTFEYMKQHKLLAVPLTTVVPEGGGVTLTFASPAYSQIQQIGRVAIVPRKLWAKQDPDTYINRSPVGSGPYALGRVTGQQVSFTARKDYWRQDVPVKQINYVTTSSTNLLAQQMVRHEVDLSYAGIPNIKSQYLDKDTAHNHLWPIRASMKPLLLNLRRAPFDNVHVRKGIALALDREKVADAYNPGVYQAVGPTGLTAQSWGQVIPDGAKEPLAQDRQAALKEMAQAGYQLKGGRLVDAKGKQLSLEILTVSTFADGMAYAQELAGQLSQLGIKATVPGEAPSAYVADEGKHNFDAVFGDAYVFGSNLYNFYWSMLSPDSTQSIIGWDDPATKAALDKLAKADPAGQTEATKGLEKIMTDQVPTIPVVVKGTPYMYSTTRYTGWPTEKNPYTTPDPGAVSGVYAEKLFLSLRPATKG
ncbi:peptide/nickel transport system substrate-binding protein [Actinacidiphila alni]|uniref:Peptide/nickel transport system substrate-binding protein n=1 Tax=Actinacidiphila alni TaxID=380248 RepID=A0A1I2HMB3_9ACTN|nr:ABC transporter substrate-binding protein [Actinacidiphila alni]SFF30668.1 peptide/nickel transport system substrate-binding protein [Actinacidiphila alni]